MCVTGPWGVGKTYAWKHYFKEGQELKAIALPEYAYVSLFGRDSLDDVRIAIVENTVECAEIGKVPDLDNFWSIAARLTGKSSGVVKAIANVSPAAGAYTTGIYRSLFLAVRKRIICFDDLERASSRLEMKSVLGLISDLKEEKECKVVIILNDEALDGANKNDFKSQLEKVVDTIITFEPTAVESTEIAIDKSTGFAEILSKCVQKLGIINIRVIKKIETLCLRVSPLLERFDPRILNQAICTVVLGTYAKFQPDAAPSLELIKEFNGVKEMVKRQIGETKENDENAHIRTLREYGFNGMDELDNALIQGIERGYFDQRELVSKQNC